MNDELNELETLEKVDKIFHDLSAIYQSLLQKPGKYNRMASDRISSALSNISKAGFILKIQRDKEMLKIKISNEKGRRYGDEEIIRIEDTKR